MISSLILIPQTALRKATVVKKMRIACLQFAPQAGEVDNNLNRADAVLAKANQDDVDSLDLLVLPELAFSGMIISQCDSSVQTRA